MPHLLQVVTEWLLSIPYEFNILPKEDHENRGRLRPLHSSIERFHLSCCSVS